MDPYPKEVIYYQDKAIMVEKDVNSESFCITIYKPLTHSRNPVVYCDQEGNIYRCHGETLYFNWWVERLFDLPQKTNLYSNKEKELILLNLLEETKNNINKINE